nr:MAG TPA: hypothetical protein [Crassvirales sp.]
MISTKIRSQKIYVLEFTILSSFNKFFTLYSTHMNI